MKNYDGGCCIVGIEWWWTTMVFGGEELWLCIVENGGCDEFCFIKCLGWKYNLFILLKVSMKLILLDIVQSDKILFHN